MKVEVTEGGELVGMNPLHLEGTETDTRCSEEAVVQWVIEMKEEDVQFKTAEEDDPLCLPQKDQLDKDSETESQNERGKSKRVVCETLRGCEYERIRTANIAERMEVLQMLDIGAAVAGNGSRCSKKSSVKSKRDGQSYHEAKARSSRQERGRRGSHGNSLDDVELQERGLAVKYWEGTLDQGSIRDIMGGEEGPVEKEQEHQKEGTWPSGSGARRLGVGFKVVGEVKLKELMKKRNESRKHMDFMRARKIRACRKCESCRRENCGACKYCQDMKRFGGRGKLKQKCSLRACEDPQI